MRNVGLMGCGALAIALGSSGCSLVLDWQECSATKACPGGYACSSDGECVADASVKTVVEVTDMITTSTTWTADNIYVLKNVVYVAPGATLTIRSGTLIKGEQASALVIRAGGKIDSRGTRNEPVVFTSAKAVGERAPADWGGVVLLGRAPVNQPGMSFEAIEDTALGSFGGTDDVGSCGVMQFTRIEFGGYAILEEAEYNGLTLGGCGSETLIDNVQIHMSGDDGVQLLGGSANLRHIVMTSITKDGLDWELGWNGTAQFVVIQQGDDDENAFESVNNDDDPMAVPRSQPTIFNFTLIGSGANGGNQRAIFMEAGAAGYFSNGIVMGQSLEALNIIGAETATMVQSNELAIENTVFFDVGPTGTHFFPLPTEESGDLDDDAGFDENVWFRKAEYGNVLGTDPQLSAPFDRVTPGWVPSAGALAGLGVRPPVHMDTSGDFLGAFRPGDTAWSDGWTAFPTN